MSKYQELVAARERAAAVLMQDDNAVNSLYLEIYIRACTAVKSYNANLFGEVTR